MLLSFFYLLREGGMKVSITEWLALLEAMKLGLAGQSVDDFYYLSRACLVKDESQLDRFDRIFAAYFKGAEDSFADLMVDVPEEWLRRQAELMLSEEERAAMPPVWQPMVRRHPVTGRASLYISPIYNDQVEGMDETEAADFIGTLAEFAERDEFVYRHRWETDDMVMWDNRCTMHLVTPYDPEERRVMHRTTIAGEEAVIAA